MDGNNQTSSHSGRKKHIDWANRSVRIEIFIVLVGSAVLLAALSLWLALSGNINNESKLVDTSKYQAVFLNGGSTSGSVTYSTYFGHITDLNNKYMVLKNVYYLTTEQSATNGTANPQLIKLGCQQLHSPTDEMVVNRDQVAFWENLQSSGKVAQAIQTFIKQNPNGPNCSQTSTQSQGTTGNPSNQ